MKKLRFILSMALALCMTCTPLLIKAESLQDEITLEAQDNATTGEDNSVSLRNTNINTTSMSLSFKGGKANCSSSVVAYASNTSTVKISMTLHKYASGSWIFVNNWSSSAKGTFLSMSESASATVGTKYRLTCVFYGDSEAITKTTERTY